MNNDRIKVRTSIPSLQEKVQTKISGSTDTIYWYIRFNLQLDEESVSGKTMNITDTDGYIMRTVITYKPKHNVISVSPLDTYEENRYYLLNISKKVRSAKGQHLRSTIHILFKLFEGKVADFKVLEDNIEIPLPKPRPKDYDSMPKKHTPTHFEKEYIDRSPPGKMVTENFSINPFLGFMGLIVVVVGLILFNAAVIIVGGVIVLIGLLHLAMQLSNRELRSTLLFNKGVRNFNNERYSQAEYNFKQALKTNPNNELARHGIRKAEIYRN
ncbi:MAG: hypothetical protein FWC91_07700 [Defluviitaleaceae bacterium]|nr:hypothetical protein [Defluviitaleaceae bacterium]